MPFKRPDKQPEPAPIKPLRIAYGPEYLQFGELYLPNDLTLMHGLGVDLAARSIAAWNIEYRRVGDAGGGWPGTLLDVARAADYLRVLSPQYSLDLKRVVPIGHSAGGHLAFWLAARPRIPTHTPLAGSSIALSALPE